MRIEIRFYQTRVDEIPGAFVVVVTERGRQDERNMHCAVHFSTGKMEKKILRWIWQHVVFSLAPV